MNGSALRRRDLLRRQAVHLGLAGAEAPRDDALSALGAWSARIDRRLGTNLAGYVASSDPHGFAEAVGRAGAALVSGIANPAEP